ncbi:MAG: hypothetical protein IJ666_08120 [Ruminococcus sp.]|nr:hypothetical protein [Ruminococcus sp.]
MREIPDYFWEWTEIDFKTGKRLVKSNVPHDVLQKLIEDEKKEFELTARRCIINVNINETAE